MPSSQSWACPMSRPTCCSPHLDYGVQRHGPDSPEAAKALDFLLRSSPGSSGVRRLGYDWIFVGDYAIEPRKTRRHLTRTAHSVKPGLFRVRDIRQMAYTDFFTSPAFRSRCIKSLTSPAAMPCRRRNRKSASLSAWRRRSPSTVMGSKHVVSPIVAAAISSSSLRTAHGLRIRGFKAEAPDYASHVRYPQQTRLRSVRTVFGWPPGSVSFGRTTKIHGAHGNVGNGFEIT